MPADDMLLVLIDLGRNVPDKSGEIVMNANDSKSLGKQLAVQLSKATGGNFKLSAETADISGGFILKNGDIEVNFGFDGLFERARGQLAPKVATMLFER